MKSVSLKKGGTFLRHLDSKRRTKTVKNTYGKYKSFGQLKHYVNSHHLNIYMGKNKIRSLHSIDRGLVDNINKERKIEYYNKPPNSFWYAIGSSWLDWCEVEEMTDWLEEGKYIYSINFDRNKVKTLSSESQLYEFDQKYGYSSGKNFRCINWIRFIAENRHIHGIELNPYYKYLPGLEWNLSWDVPSGAIWDTSTISYQLIAIRQENGTYLMVNE